MSEFDAVNQDLQRSLDEVRADRDRLREICYSLARYHAKDSDKTVFEIIEDEGKWVDQQRQWDING